MESNGKALVDFWPWCAEKGLLNSNTASTLRAACAQVLSSVLEDDWENADVTAMDPDALFSRFQNKRGKDFKPQSLRAYGQRFRQAHSLFLEYIKDPANWKFTGRDRLTKSERPTVKSRRDPARGWRNEGDAERQDGLIRYPFPVRKDLSATLFLPGDLSPAEAKRLTTFILTLAISEDAEPAAE